MRAALALVPPLLLWAAAGPPFWESKQPAQWTNDELNDMFIRSPWAGSEAEVIYLASATPMQIAEEELRRRELAELEKAGIEAEPETESDYRAYLEANPGRHIIVAIRARPLAAFQDEREVRHLEKESYIRAGKKKVRMIGHFPPVPADPVLRVVFPRELDPGARSLRIALYVPGGPQPFREVEFFLKDMTYRGKLEY